MVDKLFVWSAPLRPIRDWFPHWCQSFFSSPVHTFATLGETWTHPPGQGTSGYWFCAGNFCATTSVSVCGQQIEEFDSNFGGCLVTPDVQLEDLRHHREVIGGSYGIDFVCHNILNRILYAATPKITAVETNIPLTGYKAIINSPLGIYGRNQREWAQAIELCVMAPTGPTTPMPGVWDEIDRIHTKAMGGDVHVAGNISAELKKVDEDYFAQSDKAFQSFDSGAIALI